MKPLLFALSVLTLTACASAPSSISTSPSQNWSAYRNLVMHERDQGLITPVAAEEKIETKYREIYGPANGPDPEMEGVFAYSRRLYVMAEAGQLSTSEADGLTAARLRQIQARDEAQVQYHDWLTDRFPPNGGD
jgi:hypothetical protein